MSLLEIKNLTKTYPNGTKALQGINLSIENGMFGLLGPNGAGKSSLMRTLATLQEADGGSAFLDDIDILNSPTALRQVLGYLPQEFGVYPKISAYQILDHLAILKGISKSSERKQLVEYLLHKVNLFEKRNHAVKGFSGGMKQRVGIAQALIGSPRLIIVDEPTAGLDPGERNRFHNLLAEVSEDVIVILSTHIVDDVKELCSSMAIMNLGQIVYNGTPDNALIALEGKIWRKSIKRSEKEAYQKEYEVVSDKMVAGNPQLHIYSENDPGNGFVPVDPGLEDVFFTKIYH